MRRRTGLIVLVLLLLVGVVGIWRGWFGQKEEIIPPTAGEPMLVIPVPPPIAPVVAMEPIAMPDPRVDEGAVAIIASAPLGERDTKVDEGAEEIIASVPLEEPDPTPQDTRFWGNRGFTTKDTESTFIPDRELERLKRVYYAELSS